MNTKNFKKTFSALRSNLRIVALLMLWIVPTATLAYALMTKPQEIRTISQPPAASFTIMPELQTNVGWEVEGAKIIAEKTTVTFDASASTDPDGQIVQYIWNFGDGETGTGICVTHIYRSPGVYSAKLTVIDDAGVNSSSYKTLNAYAQPTASVTLQILASGEVGGTTTVYAMVNNVVDLYGWQAGLTFNPNALECLGFEKGDRPPDMKSDTAYIFNEGIIPGTQGMSLWIPPRIDNENGIVSIAACTLLSDASPVSGSGVLAKITFKVLSTGDWNIRLTNVILGNKLGEEIPILVVQ
jgi:hypothetical protein